MQAQAAAKNLAYYKVNYIMPIYLEFAPDVMASLISQQQAKDKTEKSEPEKEDDENATAVRSRTVFIKNLNFISKEDDIESLFKNSNLKGKVQSVKIVRRSDNQQSKGYGFVEMETVESAQRAIKKLQNFMLDDHSLKLSLTQKGTSLDDIEKEQKKSKVLKKHDKATELG